jgi:type I restriction enzyme S subunit
MRYKDSEIDWVEDLPKEWRVGSFRRGVTLLTDFESNGNFADVKKNVCLDTDDKYAWYLRATDLKGEKKSDIRTCDRKSFEFLKKTVLYGEELLISKRGEIDKIYIVPRLTRRATLAPNLYLIRVNSILYPPFAYYWFLSDFGQTELRLANKSTIIDALYKDDVKECKMVYPPYKEQKNIVSFLDQKTKKIENLIAKQKTLITLLKEKRQATVAHAVTKGVDDSIAMKNSRVEWLGDVPIHWKVVKSKRLFEQRREKAREGDIQLTVSQKYGVISQKEFMKREDRRVAQVIKGGEILKHIEPNDFVISMRSFEGGLELSTQSGSISSAYVGLIPIKEIYPLFFKYLFKSKPYIQALQSTSNLIRDGQALKFNNFSLVDLVIVPKEEQKTIANYLDKKTKQIDTLITKSTQAIELLKKRKKAIISDVVVGKMRVEI